MKALLKNIVTLLAITLSFSVAAQENNPQQMIEAIIESHLENIEEGTDVALIIEDLESLLEHPININSTNTDELSKLYILNPVQINNLLEYVKSFGPVYSIYELNVIDGLTPDILQKMEPFVEFGPAEEQKPTLKQELKNGRHEAILRGLGTLQKARGYQEKEDGTTPYEGNRDRYYARYHYQTREKFSAGFTAEKDPGEAFFQGSNKQGFDYYSAHISVKPGKTVRQFVVGDFLVRAGQGLTLWQGYTTGKSSDILSISKTGQGIRPYTSVNENAFFRGATATLDLGKLTLSIFGSHKKADGNIESNENGIEHFTSLQTSGYHRTQSEIDDEKSVSTSDAGSVLSLHFNHLKIGANLVYQHFDMPYIRSDQLYNQFRFSGDENYSGSIDYLFSKGKYQLFGEAAMSKSKGKAVVQGAVARVNDQLSFSALFRHFDKNYHALWANTFADGTNTSNESGLYFGTRILPVKFVTLSVYSDVYQSKWINYSTAGPSNGWDIFAQADVRISDSFSFYLRFKNEEKNNKFKADKIYIDIPERTQKLRLHFDYRLSDEINLKTRLEHVFYTEENSENGFMIFQDIQYSPEKLPFNLNARFAWFSTESYDSRIYAYENDLLYTFSVPAYYGKGFRTYLNLKYSFSKNLECWLKFANTHWTDRDVISSGYNEIEGNNKTELKMQLRLKF
ncbi:helix-hairpin-helix domain-containing protein [Maribellus sediminis]|uniref:helix-hairpin-helix domain-containing protein n=1 Tax=Maribellus sediminis TaxID=2696285 RepID=UPI001432146E|nr:helix-hairpin-helix domain-containing protein [Maribellus sediminis]